MRYFSPLFLRKCEHFILRHGIATNSSPLAAPVVRHGLVTFVPVRVDNVLLRSFEANFLGNRAPYLDFPALQGCAFHYAFDEEGVYDETASKAEPIRFAAAYERHIIGDIYIPRSVRSGDVLLCSRRRESPSLSAEIRAPHG